MFSRPSFGLAEIAWRWSFGAAMCSLLLYGFAEFLDTLPVTPADMLLLRSRQPVLVSRAFARILHGSAPRAVAAFLVLTFAASVLWIAANSFGRLATVRALFDYFRSLEPADSTTAETLPIPRTRSLVGLGFLRITAVLAAAVGSVAAFVAVGIVSNPADPSPGAAFLVFLAVLTFVWMAWSMLNWILSLAAVFAVSEGRDTFGALGAALGLCRSRPGSVFAVGFWFGTAHLTAFVVATSAIGFPLSFAPFLPPAVTIGGVLMVTLVYFAIADFLYVGRLGGYVAILELPDPPVPEPVPPVVPPAFTIDRDELILSDLSATSA